MTEDRIYRKGMSTSEGRIELQRSAGTHLDATVVTALIDVLGVREGLAA